MNLVTETRDRRQRGNVSIEFALSVTLLWTMVGGVYSLGHSLYAYNKLTVAVSNAARFGGRDGLGSSVTQFADRIKNVAVYGNPEGTGDALLTGLQTSNVDVAIEQDAAGVPRSVTVGIQNYTLDGVFWTTSLINKPYATARYAGRYQPYAS